VLKLLVTANVPSELILSILMTEGIRSTETSALTRETRCHIPEDGILYDDSLDVWKAGVGTILVLYIVKPHWIVCKIRGSHCGGYEECRLVRYKPKFVPHSKHFTSPPHSPAGYCYVRLEVFMAATVKNAVFWDRKTHFIPHRRHITFPLQNLAS
jgi:hypothetical protein